jgi:secondary thiamine-phosphate synthase enzyme
MMQIFQNTIKLKAKPRGFNLVTSEIENGSPDMKKISVGLAHIFIQHTSASLTISENADPTVQTDLENYFTRSVQEDDKFYRHSSEGSDYMPSHIKNCILGSSLTIPITNGRMNLGIWQGIYLCEHRNNPRPRTLVITVFGD